MSSDILIIHPYKHHAFNLAAGCLAATEKVEMAFPLYMKGFASLLRYAPSSIKTKAEGYFYDKLPSSKIYSPNLWQLRKLKSFLSHPRVIEKQYDLSISKLIKSGFFKPKVLITLQDHMSQTVSVAHSMGIKIWSDQIINMSEDAQNRISLHCERYGIRYERSDESRNNQVISSSNIITVPSCYVKDGISDRINTWTRIASIPYGVNIGKFGLKRATNKERILIVARANSVRKGGHLLIESLLRCSNELQLLSGKQKIEIFFLGLVENELRPLFEKLCSSTKCSVTEGNVPHALVPKLLAETDLFIMPTLSEGMSLAIPEAMAAGVPIITTPYCGVDVFKHGEMGLTVNDKTDSITEALLTSFKNMNQLVVWGEAGRKAIQDYDWLHYESNISNLAKSIIE